MPEDLPDRGKIRAAGEHLARERVPQAVRVQCPTPAPR